MGIESFLDLEITSRLFELDSLSKRVPSTISASSESLFEDFSWGVSNSYGFVNNTSFNLLNEIEKGLTSLSKSIKRALSQLAGGIFSSLEGLGAFILKAIDTAFDNFKSSIELFSWTIFDFAGAIMAGMTPALSMLISPITGISSAISDAFKFDVDEFVKAYTETLKAIREKQRELLEVVGK